jgi:hypothetical protein
MRLATGQWFSPGIPVSSTNKTDRHDIAEILLKVALQLSYDHHHDGLFVQTRNFVYSIFYFYVYILKL